jgi:hypothetical protein
MGPNPRQEGLALVAHRDYLSHIWGLDTERTHTGIQETPSSI